MEPDYSGAIQAIATGLRDGGAEASYNFPGFFSHDIFKALGGEQISLNERVACAEAFGASLAGRRSVVTFKNVGLNIASDAFLHAVIAGVRAGMVLVVTDDISVWGSQESQDSRSFADFFGGIWLEPGTLQQAYDLARQSFELSERLDLPVVIRLTNEYFDLNEEFRRAGKMLPLKDLPKIQPSKFVVHPVYYRQQQSRLDEKNHRAKEFAEQRSPVSSNAKFAKGLVVVGAAGSQDSQDSEADVIRVNTYPLPESALRVFAQQHQQVEVIEAGGPYVASKLRALTSQATVTSAALKPHGTAVRFTKWQRYHRLFEILKSMSAPMVVGDITQFTVETTDSIKAALSLGTAVSVATGYAEASGNFAYALSGDCSFLHEGVGILGEAVQRGVRVGVIVIDNGGSWCTGGQPPAGNILPGNVSGVYMQSLDYESASDQALSEALKRMKDYPGVSCLHLKVPMGDFSREAED